MTRDLTSFLKLFNVGTCVIFYPYFAAPIALATYVAKKSIPREGGEGGRFNEHNALFLLLLLLLFVSFQNVILQSNVPSWRGRKERKLLAAFNPQLFLRSREGKGERGGI